MHECWLIVKKYNISFLFSSVIFISFYIILFFVFPSIKKQMKINITFFLFAKLFNIIGWLKFLLSLQINLFSDRIHRTSEGNVERTTSNKTFPAHLTSDYYLDGLTPGTKYEAKVSVDLQDAGIGDPITVSFTTKSESKKDSIIVTLAIDFYCRKIFKRLILKFNCTTMLIILINFSQRISLD